ncbi:26S proteasome regulatory subunitA [Sesamum alatum]|uniref:26S proteasome regulatory subunitA n=1 Tax=Sesamum alatum TaxID=300844 RepID=A0AAE1YL34_9LAMI|nr:26S proteasome regulatory subunitA [Sesamum alatum]
MEQNLFVMLFNLPKKNLLASYLSMRLMLLVQSVLIVKLVGTERCKGLCWSCSMNLMVLADRVDILDPTLMRSGRLDRKIEFPHPTEEARANILQIHSRKMNVHPDVNFEELARSIDDFNGAQLKAICVEAGMLALHRDATEVNHEDFNEGIIQAQAKKKASLNYYA